ncbi:MAG: polysaccharide biosynthesis protein [Oscillospiraceae bacterium]|nr:polysaccharide biosynthesis protein [Oscillospiraceae bacterium]
MEKRNSLLVQGSILAAAGLITKLLGFLYRIPMANLLGEQGNGIYSVAYSIYNIALTLSSYALPSAVSKLISERLGRRDRAGAQQVFRASLLFAAAGGLAAFAALYFGADWLESVYGREGLARPLKVLGPTTLVVALLGVLRGWFQGRGNMRPTAVSQVLEQVVNVAGSLLATWQMVRLYEGKPELASFGAAGGTVGTLAGAAAALLFMWLLYAVARSGAKPLPRPRESDASVRRALLWTVVPMILSQTIYQMGSTVDDLLFGRAMERQQVADAVAAAVQGVYNTQYNQLTTLPVAITTALAATLLPAISLLWSRGERREAMRRTRTVIKLNMVVAIPAAVGLAVLAEPIMTLLFPRLTEYRDLSVQMMETGSIAIVFYALSTISAAVLQGGGHMGLPAVHAGVSLVLHAVLVYVLLNYTELGIHSLIVGNVTFPLLLSLLNCAAVRTRLGYRWETFHTFTLPVLFSLLMGLLARGLYAGLTALKLGTLLSFLVSVAAAVAFYGLAVLRLGVFTKSEFPELPMSRVLSRIAGIPQK